MSEKQETIIPMGVFSVRQRPATRKHCLRTFVAGALIGATALWSLTGTPDVIRHALTPNTKAPAAFDDLKGWITHEAEFGNRKIFDREWFSGFAASFVIVLTSC
jgi:hypothetical protein